MNASYSKKATQLKIEAASILNDKKLWASFTKWGKINPAGSFALDLLVYPDLDVYFETHEPASKIDDIFAYAIQVFILHPDVVSIRLEKKLHTIKKIVPKGIYLQVKLKVKTGNIWQIDIWYLSDKKVQDAILNDLEKLKGKLTPEKRDLILETKHAIMRPDGCTPSFSSYYVYQAVLNEGLRNLSDIKNYIKKQRGIEL